MPSRRTFLGTTAAALAATATRTSVADARTSTDENAQQGGALPPAIAALTPMTAGVKPITVDERRARIDKATRLMRDNKIDALMLTGGTSLQYFTKPYDAAAYLQDRIEYDFLTVKLGFRYDYGRAAGSSYAPFTNRIIGLSGRRRSTSAGVR